MPVNRNALIRYKTLDKCLQNRYRKWTLDDLIDACSDALYEYEGINKGVSKRTVQGDLQTMRSNKLGYNAPIIVIDKKFYTYEDSNYSITNIPLSDQDLGMLSEAVEFMKQFQGFSHFKELDGMVQKLEDHIYAQKTDSKPVIDFEKNENLKGLEHLDRLYKSIIQKKSIDITYQSFKARRASTFHFHPYLLKEYRNRWFVVGVKKGNQVLLYLALDRIAEIAENEVLYIENDFFDAELYFKDAIGISVSPNVPTEEVLLYVIHKHAPYVITKPFHHSQKIVERDNYGVTFSINVQHNFELEKEILGFGDGIKVIAPKRLKRVIRDRLSGAIDLYMTELNEGKINSAIKQLIYKGSTIFNYVYSKRLIKKIKGVLNSTILLNNGQTYGERLLIKKVPELKELLLNHNLNRIIKSIDENAFLTKAIYLNKTTEHNWLVNWHQDVAINVTEKIETEGFYNWTKKEEVISVHPPEGILKNTFSIRIHLDDTDKENGALKVLLGSHKKVHSKEAINLITHNTLPMLCEINSGGIQIMKPLIVHASSKAKKPKQRKVIHLEFSSSILTNGLEWLEREEI